MALSDEERLVLDFEGRRFKYQGAKEVAIRELFGNVTHYYQRLAHLLDREDALAYAPMLVRRLNGRRTSLKP